MEGIMITDTRDYFRKILKLSALSVVAMSLSGCLVAVPPALQMASLALDGVSYVTTGKSVTDHAISTVTAQDCAMTRGLKGEDICSANVVEVAMLPDGTPVLQADDVAYNLTSEDRAAQYTQFTEAQTVSAGEDADEVLDIPETAANAFDMQTASGPML